MYISICLHVCQHEPQRAHLDHRQLSGESVHWPVHDIVIANIVWCIAYKRESGGEVVYCPIIVQ